MNGLIIVVVALLGCAYAQMDNPMALAMLSGGLRGSASSGMSGGMDPMSLALLGGAGNSKMLRMMTFMNMMKPQEPTPAEATPADPAQPRATQDNTSVNPMMNTLMTLSLCKISDTAGDQRFWIVKIFFVLEIEEYHKVHFSFLHFFCSDGRQTGDASVWSTKTKHLGIKQSYSLLGFIYTST
uniref:Uncharacterized protein n=1 Tax=Magallana gigas TaxID=29159 RepID=A0A8W8L097_MAGGI